jgi:hypothetical protein
MPVAPTTFVTDHPVHVEVESPVRFDRDQVVLRVVIALALGWLGITYGFVVGLLYVALPVIAAVAATPRDRFVSDVEPRLWRVLRWMLQLCAYMMLVVDRFPVGADADTRVTIRFGGSVTPRTALARLVSSIPSAIVLAVLWCVSSLVWIISAVNILVDRRVPDWALAFQRGVLRWNARLVAYHASFIDEYPPFVLDCADADRAVPIDDPARSSSS